MRTGLLLLVFVSMASCAAQKSMPIRPITIQVVDQETRRPLEGVPVFYALHTKVFKKYVLLVIPSLEPDIGPKVAYKSRAVTDRNGEVRFHARDFMLPQDERFEMESIVINMDVDMTTRMAKISKRLLESYYAKGRVRRDGPVDNIDMADEYIVENRKAREEVMFRPIQRYTGAVIRNLAAPPYRTGEVSDWFEEGENYSMSYGGNSLEKDGDSIVVFLKPVKQQLNGPK